MMNAAVTLVRSATVCAVAALALSGCGETKKILGLERHSPDEFVVVAQAPLTIPPDMQSLPPPNPGAPRPQAASASGRAAAAVFGNGKADAKGSGKSTGGGGVLLAEATRYGVDSNVRRKVDQETSSLAVADKSWVDSLLFWRKSDEKFTAVDPKKESQRLRQAEAEGKPINEGTVPVIERKRKALFEGLF